MRVSGWWVAAGAVAIAGAVVVAVLSVFTGMSETALLWIGVLFGASTGVAIVLAQREREQPKQTRRKRR